MLFDFFKKKTKFPTVDRRREARYPAEDEFLVEFSVKGESPPATWRAGASDGQGRGSHYLGNSRDISIHGVRFATTSNLRLREELILNFRLPQAFPGTRHFSVIGKVVRIYKPRGASRHRVGCSLEHEDEGTQEILRQFIYWLEHRTG